MPSLIVTFENVCAFVLSDMDTEAWFVRDSRHAPILNLGSAEGSSGAEVDLAGCIVTFGDAQGPFPPRPGTLGGHHIERLIDLEQVAPGASLASGWTPGSHHLPDGMSARVFVSGCLLVPQELKTSGGSRDWRIGGKVVQRLSNETVCSRTVQAPPVLRITRLDGTTEETQLSADAKGNFPVRIASKDIDGQSDLLDLHGVVFVTEFKVMDAFLRVNGSPTGLPVPHAYWPDFDRQTDPLGGPCPECLLDLRTRSAVFVTPA